jgi:hypothetical protein
MQPQILKRNRAVTRNQYLYTCNIEIKKTGQRILLDYLITSQAIIYISFQAKLPLAGATG